jgi:AraC-like DNA-binding protein
LSRKRLKAPAVVGLGRGEPNGSSQPEQRQGPQAQGCPVGALSEVSNLMREAGHDPWDLLESFGISQELMSKPMTPVPISLHGQILQAAADATGRDDFGLLIGQRSTRLNAGPLRLLVYNARTAREAVQAIVRYHGLWYRGITLDLTADRGFACLSVTLGASIPGSDHVLTAYLAALVKHLEAIFPRSWRPSQVHISYRRPRMAEQYARFFRAPVLYDQPRHAVFFAESVLDEARHGTEQMLDSFLREYMGELEAREQPDFASRVRHVIESMLASGECSAVRVADMFAIHRVTLHRYLREQGTTFEQLLDDARRNLATRMLEQTDLPVGEIAGALGYATPTSFVRAFKRWHGVTPGAGRSRRPAIGRAASPARTAPRH